MVLVKGYPVSPASCNGSILVSNSRSVRLSYDFSRSVRKGTWGAESIEERRAACLLSLGDQLYASVAMAWCMALAICSSDASEVQNGGMA